MYGANISNLLMNKKLLILLNVKMNGHGAMYFIYHLDRLITTNVGLTYLG